MPMTTRSAGTSSPSRCYSTNPLFAVQCGDTGRQAQLDALVGVFDLVEIRNLGRHDAAHDAVCHFDDGDVQSRLRATAATSRPI